MKKPLVLCIVIILMESLTLSAQETWSNGKALNLPFKKYGISFGNSYEFNGIRINFADKNVKRINGLNVTFWIKKFKNNDAVVNGISLGIIPTAGSMQPINIGLFGVGTSSNNLNGLSIGGIVIGSGGNINGLSLSGIVTMADGKKSVISGIAISGLGIGAAQAINGLAIAGISIGTEGNINGVASCIGYLSCPKKFRGIGVTLGYLESNNHMGIAIAGCAKTNQMHGLSIALYNKTKELHGIQFGLINYAKNNPKGLRVLPFINMHLRKNQNISKKDE
jgi:hypothetical protein